MDRERSLQRAFARYQDARYGGRPVLPAVEPKVLIEKYTFSPDDPMPEIEKPRVVKKASGARPGWIDLGRVAWSDSDKVVGGSVHRARTGNRAK